MIPIIKIKSRSDFNLRLLNGMSAPLLSKIIDIFYEKLQQSPHRKLKNHIGTTPGW